MSNRNLSAKLANAFSLRKVYDNRGKKVQRLQLTLANPLAKPAIANCQLDDRR